MRKRKVLVLSIVDFANTGNGGGLWAAHLLESLACVPDTDFTAVSIVSQCAEGRNRAFVESLGWRYIFLALRAASTFDVGAPLGRLVKLFRRGLNVMLGKYFFSLEREASGQRNLDTQFSRIVEEHKPDIIIMVYLLSTLFVPSVFQRKIPCCMVTVNDEAAFHRAQKSLGGPSGKGLRYALARWLSRRGNWISNERIRRYERRVYGQCAGIVALTQGDIPDDLPSHVRQMVLPPIFKESSLQWSYHASRSVFFVGNIGYYPNRLAIEWLCMSLAPELLRIDESIQINIIGADAVDVPSEWQLPNISFMGISSRDEVIRQMTVGDLFIAPIANRFGAKIKLAECISYGMPFLATQAAMSGLSFLKSVTPIDLDDPSAAARRIINCINSPNELVQSSRTVAAEVRQARLDQVNAWDDFLNSCMQ